MGESAGATMSRPSRTGTIGGVRFSTATGRWVVELDAGTLDGHAEVTLHLADGTPVGRARRASHAHARLSERELEVLRLIALGYTNREIAEELVLSVRTVEMHRARLARKLGCTRRAELVRWALTRGLVS